MEIQTHHGQRRLGMAGMLLLLCLVPLVFLPGREAAFYNIKLVVTAVSLGIWVLGLVTLRILDGERLRRYGPDGLLLRYWEPDWLDALPLVLLFGVLISTAGSINPEQSLMGFADLPEGLFSWVLYMMIYYLFRHEGIWSENAMKAVLVVASLIALLGLLQFIDWLPFFGGDRLSQGMATIGNRNFIGTYVTLMLPLAIWFWMEKGKWPYLVAATLLFLLLLSSLTRSAWVAFLVWFPLQMVMEIRKGKGVKRLLLFTGIIIVAFFLADLATGHLFLQRVRSILRDMQDLSADDAGSSRILIWKLSAPLLLERPLTGFGPDTFDQVFYSIPDVPIRFIHLRSMMKAHNEWLQIGVTMGLPTLAAYLVLVGGSITRGVRDLMGRIGKPAKGEGLSKGSAFGWKVPVFCAIVGYLVQAQFNISITVNAVIFWAFLGLLASQEKTDGQVEESHGEQEGNAT